ncbi:hypothetical protein TNCV_3691131 [Trichonephila clavipes]|nr:hypothetical protein TNCV_3691131 [Trichonephila clavipes]
MESLPKPGDDTLGDSKFLGYFQLGTPNPITNSKNLAMDCHLLPCYQQGSGSPLNNRQEHAFFFSPDLVIFRGRLGDVQVACPPRKPRVAGSNPAGVDRFSGCEDRGHTSHDIVAYQRSFEYQFCSFILCKIKSSGLASGFKRQKFGSRNHH